MNKNGLKLRELIDIPMNGVSLQHKDIAERIDDVSLSCLSQYGKEMWDDILEAKLERLGGSTLVISGVSTEWFCEFRKLMLGECDADLYEKCMMNAETYLADEAVKPAVGFLPNIVDLIATYEDLKNVSPQERLTAYFGDYGMNYMVNDFDLDTVRNARDEALRFMGMTQEEFTCNDAFWYRQNIRLRMREGMMADKIQTGDEICLSMPEQWLLRETSERLAGGYCRLIQIQKPVWFRRRLQRQKYRSGIFLQDTMSRFISGILGLITANPFLV